MKISGGQREDGVVVGNTYDKYGSRNPIVKWIMKGFTSALTELVQESAPRSIHEIGCGEGYWVLSWAEQGFLARGSDFSSHVIDIARENSVQRGISAQIFRVGSIYDLNADRDSADLIVCCEVLEHLEDPQEALRALKAVVSGHLIISVPREPIWRSLNLARGRYISALGNTPGHIQHWSTKHFIELVSPHFDIVAIRTPLPWTMLLCRPRSQA